MSWLLGQWARVPQPPAGGGSEGPQKPGDVDEKKEGSFRIEETKVRRWCDDLMYSTWWIGRTKMGRLRSDRSREGSKSGKRTGQVK